MNELVEFLLDEILSLFSVSQFTDFMLRSYTGIEEQLMIYYALNMKGRIRSVIFNEK